MVEIIHTRTSPAGLSDELKCLVPSKRLVPALQDQFLCCLQLICLHTFTFTMTGAKKATTHFSSHFHFHNDRSWKSDNSFVFTLSLSQRPELKKRQLICLHTFTFTMTGTEKATTHLSSHVKEIGGWVFLFLWMDFGTVENHFVCQ